MKKMLLIFESVIVFSLLLCGCINNNGEEQKKSFIEIFNDTNSRIEVIYDLTIGNWTKSNDEPIYIDEGDHKIIDFEPEFSESDKFLEYIITASYPGTNYEYEFHEYWSNNKNQYFALTTFYVRGDINENTIRIILN